MTYCIGVKLDQGLVFLSDSRTNAGLDSIGTFRKMMIYERPGDRFMVMLTAGNLSISQQVREILQNERLAEGDGPPITIWNATMILGGQIGTESMRLFLVYSAGNFIEATKETCFFQIGESKYGKPVLDRMIHPGTPLDEAAKCVLVSMDSTLKSNLSVGLPLDLVVYQAGSLQSDQIVCIDEQNPYFRMIRETWGQRLREVFESLDAPEWNGEADALAPLVVPARRYERMKRITHPGERIV